MCVEVIEREEEEEKGEGEEKTSMKEWRAFFEAALGVCGCEGEATEALWELYEAKERAAGEHKRAHNLRWRREKKQQGQA
jgi:hypothetical protein